MTDRHIQHTGYAARRFEDVFRLFADDDGDLLSGATNAASDRADTLVEFGPARPQSFTVDEIVSVTATPIDRVSADRAVIGLDWQAEPGKRLLPNLDAKLLIDAVIPSGRHATTAVSIVGDFDPPNNLFHAVKQSLVTRQIIDAVVHTFIVALVVRIEAQVPPPQ